MKRLLSLVIVLALVLGVLASCDLPFDLPFLGGNGEADVQEVVKMLNDMYEDDNGTSIQDGYELVAQYKIGKTVFSISWTSDNADIKIDLVDGLYVVTLPKNTNGQSEYKLIATITSDGGQTATVEYNRVLTESFGMITNPVVGTAYKLALLHGNEGPAVVYFDGNNYNNYAWYFSYTTDVLSAVDVYLETVEGVEGGYRLYFDKDGVKTYIVAFPRDGDTTKGTLKFDTVCPTEYFTYSTEHNTLVYTSVTGQQFFMGSSGTFKSISCSAIDYLSNPTNYPVRLYGVGGVEETLKEQNLPTIPDNYTSEDVVEALYKLQSGQTIEDTYVITGVVTSIKYAYDPSYSNISVNIVVGNLTNKPVLLYRITGEGADTLKVGDTVTVRAGLTNYNGTYETTSGGVIENIVPGTGEDTPPAGGDHDTSTAEGILNTLYGLADGETVTGSFTLTGKITALDSFNNPTIVVEGFEDKPVYCFKLVVDKAVGDTITVTATTMKNYEGTYEFMNCTLVTGDSGNDTPSTGYGAPVVGTAYKFFLEQNGLNKVLYFNGTVNADGRMLTTENFAEAAEIFFETADGGYHIYIMVDGVKNYINTAPYINDEGYIKCRLALSTEANCVWTYNTSLGIVEAYVEHEGKNDTFFAGTYGTYNTISLSGAYYKSQIASGSQYPARIVLASDGEVTPPEHTHNFVNGECSCGETDPNYQAPTGPAVVASPVVGTAYKLGMFQSNKNANYYLAGGMNGYYMATTTDYAAALDFYLEATDGGYYLYCFVNGTKTYVNFVVSDTHVNGAYETTANTVFTFNSNGIFSTMVDGVEYGFGTYGDYVTLGPNKTSYTSNYFGYFYSDGTGSDSGDDNTTTHTHSYVDGMCSCGEADPNYQPPTGDDDDTTDNTDGTYVKVTTAAQFTNGTYVLMAGKYAATTVSSANSPWLQNNSSLVVNNGVIADAQGATITVVVNGSTATLMDANGKYIAPKGGNNNGVKASTTAYEWTWSMDDDGNITFTGNGEDTVTLAYNQGTNGGNFRGYKNTTVSGSSSGDYITDFVVYKYNG